MFPVIILDIENNGLELNAAINSSFYSVQADNDEMIKKRLGWITGGNAVLFMDLDGNNCVNRSDEIFFGSYSGIPSDSSYSMLKIFDTNKDLSIDENDDFYKHLSLWNDRNGNGICEKEEVKSLSDYGITINLDARKVNKVLNGNTIVHEFTFTIRDENGTELTLNGYDVFLDVLE